MSDTGSSDGYKVTCTRASLAGLQPCRVTHYRSRTPVVGEKVVCCPKWWTRQWVDGLVLALRPKKALIEYTVNSDWYGKYFEARWVPLRRVVRLPASPDPASRAE